MIDARGTISDTTVVIGTFLFNCLYATILFDSGTAKSFIIPKFRPILSHMYRKLDEHYLVEMSSSESGSTQEILENCLLTLNNHTFHIILMSMTI